MIKIMSVMPKPTKISVTIFLVLILKKTCLMSHAASTLTYQTKPQNLISLIKLNILAYKSKLQLSKQSHNQLSIHHVDAIESIAKKNIANVLRMVESAPKSVFALIVIINLQYPVSKLMYSNFGKSHTCSKTFNEIIELLIFQNRLFFSSFTKNIIFPEIFLKKFVFQGDVLRRLVCSILYLYNDKE